MGPWTNFCGAVANDALLASMLIIGPVRDPRQERRLTALRRHALFNPAPHELLAHLAIQCFLNEYVWWAEPDEQQRVEALSDRADADSLLRVACYRRLTEDHPGPVALRAVVRVQVLDVEAEREIAASIPALTPISAGLSQAVQAMYEENPYPRWSSLGRPAPQSGPRDILIAGCGTGRHALHIAMQHPDAQVLAVDLSRASLSYGIRKGRELGVTNVEWGQADLLRLAELGRTFDHIECIGTLVCMETPAEGLAVLASMMRPAATLTLGLYSETARRPLFAAMEQGRGVEPTPEGIRSMRREIMESPADSPLRGAMTFPDFYSASNFRDMLLHVQEHRHTIPQIGILLASQGLRFAGFNLSAGVLQKFRAEFTDEMDLGQWAEFEERHPTTFVRMYQFRVTT